jgi:hypothetical protein
MGKSCPKHVELILEINKLLLLHLVGLLYYLATLMMHGQIQIKPPIYVWFSQVVYLHYISHSEIPS